MVTKRIMPALSSNTSPFPGVHDRRDQMTIRLGDAAVDRRLVVAGQLAFFHAGHADEADHALGILEDQPGADLSAIPATRRPYDLGTLPWIGSPAYATVGL